MQRSPGESRLVVFSFFFSSDKSINNPDFWLSVFVVCILSITQTSFKLIVLLLFQFPVVWMTQWFRDFVAWTIFCIETCFRSLFQAFLEHTPYLASFFLLYPVWALGSFVNMLLFCTFDSESWIVYFHQCLLSDTLESAVLLHATSICEGISSLFSEYWRFPLFLRCFLHIDLY